MTMTTQVEFTRTFQAPRELVFKAFTEPEHLQNWWGPKGWTFHVAEADFSTDGVLHYSQKPAGGEVMWVKFVYGEIIVPEKFVYTSFFSDEEGSILRAPFDPNWPLVTLNTMTFIEDGDQTILTVIVAPESSSEEEIATFEASKEMVQEGFNGTFDQLTEYLTKI